MTHQIPSHLAFCTPRKNQKAKQGKTDQYSIVITKPQRELCLILKRKQCWRLRLLPLISRNEHEFVENKFYFTWTVWMNSNKNLNSKILELLFSLKKKLTKLKLWCCYIGLQPQSSQIYVKSKPINEIK